MGRSSTPAASVRQRSKTSIVAEKSSTPRSVGKTTAPTPTPTKRGTSSRSPSVVDATAKQATLVVKTAAAAAKGRSSKTPPPPSKKRSVSKTAVEGDAGNLLEDDGGKKEKRLSKRSNDVEKDLARPHRGNTDIQPASEDLYELVDFEQASPIVQNNHFIRHGYRFEYNTRMCIKSFFQHHNETGNVWTHFIGLLVFFALSALVYYHILEANWSHYIVFTFFMFGCAMCMACSCVYHLFNCHHDSNVASKMFMFDLLGIATLITASFVPYVYFSFACLPQWRVTYLVMIGVLGSGGIAAPFVDLDERFAIYRTLLYVAITCSGLFPTAHILYGFPVSDSPIAAPLSGLALMFLLYGTGLIFYLAKIPERWYPGHFDYWLCSHQIWHMFVLAAALVHFAACVSLYRRYHFMDTHGGFHC